ncbi:MAG: hypothetical protein EPN84_07935 [Legionella sp.]|nr:MAG: hypothetical protein EPN84_07935 [Legionella sp.]
MSTMFSYKPDIRILQNMNVFNLAYASYQLFKNPEQAPILALEMIIYAATTLALSDNASRNQRRVGAALNFMIGLYYAQQVTPINPNLFKNILDTLTSFTCAEVILHELTLESYIAARKV